MNHLLLIFFKKTCKIGKSILISKFSLLSKARQHFKGHPLTLERTCNDFVLICFIFCLMSTVKNRKKQHRDKLIFSFRKYLIFLNFGCRIFWGKLLEIKKYKYNLIVALSYFQCIPTAMVCWCLGRHQLRQTQPCPRSFTHCPFFRHCSQCLLHSWRQCPHIFLAPFRDQVIFIAPADPRFQTQKMTQFKLQ